MLRTTVDELEKLIVGAVSLAAAQGKTESQDSAPEAIGQAAKGAAGRVLEGIRTTGRTAVSTEEGWRRRVLWVDDQPTNNVYERQAFEPMGISFTLAKTTQAPDIGAYGHPESGGRRLERGSAGGRRPVGSQTVFPGSGP